MHESFLITGNYNPLNRSLISRILDIQGKVILAARTENEKTLASTEFEGREDLNVVLHNSRSALSTRSLFLDLQNTGQEISNLIIVHNVAGKSDVLQGLSNVSIEETVDTELKGFLFILKEATSWFQRRENGSINIVLQNNGPEVPSPTDALVIGGLEALSDSMFTYYGKERYAIRGFTTRDSDDNAFAEYIIQGIREHKATARWHVFKPRAKLFNITRN